jgi:hypothetical protein
MADSYREFGFNKHLQRDTNPFFGNTPGLGSGSSIPGGGFDVVSSPIYPSQVQSGDFFQHLTLAKDGVIMGGATGYNEGVGFWLGYDLSDDLYKFFIGDPAGDYLTWDGTTLIISGSITATTGTIGGFDIGLDYIRDVANSFGLASTVTGGDDVRFWAGASFANRATAPTRITEAGAAVFTSVTISGLQAGSSIDGQYQVHRSRTQPSLRRILLTRRSQRLKSPTRPLQVRRLPIQRLPQGISLQERSQRHRSPQERSRGATSPPRLLQEGISQAQRLQRQISQLLQSQRLKLPT